MPGYSQVSTKKRSAYAVDSEENARAYLTTEIFSNDVVGELKSLLEADPEVRIYSVA